MAAEQGHAGSQNNLGALYESGHGVPQDNSIALDLYRQAAKGGDINAVSNVHRLEALMKDKEGKLLSNRVQARRGSRAPDAGRPSESPLDPPQSD